MIAPRQAALGLADVLQPGERIVFAVRPDMRSILRSKRILIWIGLAWLGAVALVHATGTLPNGVLVPLALAGAAMLAAPFVIAFEVAFTTYAVTDRRALIVRRPPARPPFVSVAFADMDREIEVLETGGGAGHLYFASGRPTRMRDTDFTGKLAFRDVADVHKLVDLLTRARNGTATSAR
ncbi:MAG: hypothetical protein KJZ73_15220 [Pseudorhodoplanes sp.]|nr:hypothetical protein [Pseudorhodoplanes sp.]MCL4712593.1 hypothetical protein [Pseudorhodoplanes sp.]GIK81846.1 MAG: hypothetical protein BroJett024_29510 [Alphaproteobacteria bacterium]